MKIRVCKTSSRPYSEDKTFFRENRVTIRLLSQIALFLVDTLFEKNIMIPMPFKNESRFA